MSSVDGAAIEQRIQGLESHLERENPILLDAVRSYRKLDKVAYGMGLLQRNESYATRIGWWPIVSVLGTYSSGKSTFINTYVGQRLQATGNQAVDDKFTVICYGSEETPRVLPGLALDADPRFPFYQISEDIEKVASGEGRRVDVYLQLKTCPSERMSGKMLIDSPGFDADAQRNATLRITQKIISLSDLVLVFFDARHPEPGAMGDTLQHLVKETIDRPDANKFLYILNQMDTAAREDNPEEVFAAWQRALAQSGLTAGRFYRIYDKGASIPIEDGPQRERFETKRDVDVAEIYGRMQRVEVERAYRVVGLLEKMAKGIETDFVPRLRDALGAWKRTVLWIDGILLAVAAIALGWLSFSGGWWQELPPWLSSLLASPIWGPAVGILLLAAALYLHHMVRRLVARRIATRALERDGDTIETRQSLRQAFLKSTSWWRSIFFPDPSGWGPLARRRISKVVTDADHFVQKLNNRFTAPAGGDKETAGEERPEPTPGLSLSAQ